MNWSCGGIPRETLAYDLEAGKMWAAFRNNEYNEQDLSRGSMGNGI